MMGKTENTDPPGSGVQSSARPPRLYGQSWSLTRSWPWGPAGSGKCRFKTLVEAL